MLALTFDGQLNLEDRPRPRPRADEALVRVRLAGICNTDLEIVRGYMGFEGVLGHEFTGVVEECANRRWIGRRVVAEINAPCGACAMCERGLERHCFNRTVTGIAGRDGAFAEFVTVPIGNLHEIRKSIPDTRAVFTEPLAACFEILEQLDVRMKHRIAVIGDGKLGALAAGVLCTVSDGVVLLGKHEDKMARISQSMGVRTAFFSSQPQQSFDIVVECSGSPSGLEAAADLVRPRGTIVLKSTYHGSPCPDTSRWVVNEIQVLGSRCGPFGPALNALRGGDINPEPLIDATYEARDALQAIHHAQQPGVFKILIQFSQ
jgi:threonine dehydrogenase-like Zn-dependent dehydrogenase